MGRWCFSGLIAITSPVIPLIVPVEAHSSNMRYGRRGD